MDKLFFFLFIFILVVLVAAGALNYKKVSEFFGRLKVFFGEVGAEMQKVSWPTKDEVINSTVLVMVSAFVLTICLWITDLAIGSVIRFIYS